MRGCQHVLYMGKAAAFSIDTACWRNKSALPLRAMDTVNDYTQYFPKVNNIRT